MPDRKTLEIKEQFERQNDNVAVHVSEMFDNWKRARRNWEERADEVRSYVFATDTSTTTNAKLPWKNKTTLPKLSQIRDNLHANYLSALFPRDRWLKWEARDEEVDTKEMANAIETYMLRKTGVPQFRSEISKLIYDYIDYGNAFATVEYVNEEFEDPVSKEIFTQFAGPVMKRISPKDIVFNIASSSFEASPKIVRHLTSVGDIAKMVNSRPNFREHGQDALRKLTERREKVAEFEPTAINDFDGYTPDGFGSLKDYYESGMVEVLEFYGDIYDEVNEELFENHVITIVDRSFIVRMEPIPAWLGKSNIKHVTWRDRPDNLMGMGPLDNLVGMQYRIDHLENLKADVFDLIAFPPVKIKGQVDDFNWGPLEKIFVDEEGDVELMSPDTQALNADLQIRLLEDKMELYAGAPREAMGVRTPGEKTAFEVQVLEAAASRIFQLKITKFEEQLLEPILNSMLAEARRQLDNPEILRAVDLSDDEADTFVEISREQLRASGDLRPMGARHFTERAQLTQEVSQFMNTMAADPGVRPHISGFRLAKLFEETLGLEEHNLVENNIQVSETAETKIEQMLAQEEMLTTAQTPGTVPGGAGITDLAAGGGPPLTPEQGNNEEA